MLNTNPGGLDRHSDNGGSKVASAHLDKGENDVIQTFCPD